MQKPSGTSSCSHPSKLLFPTMLLALTVLIAAGTVYGIYHVQRGLNDMYAIPGEEAPLFAVVGNPQHGRQLFSMSCINCHGPNGTGVPMLGANLVHSKFVRLHPDAELIAFIKVGRKPGDVNSVMNGTMPEKGANPTLDDGMLQDVVAFLRTLQNGTAPPAPLAPVVISVMGAGDVPNDPSIGELQADARDDQATKITDLLKTKPELVSNKDTAGHTALHWACGKGHGEVADLLLTNKSDVNARDNRGETPLFLAAHEGYKNVAKLLITNSADVNAGDSNGVTPLEIAAAKGHGDVAAYLAKKADVNAKDNKGNTALHAAATAGEAEIVNALLDKNADASIKNADGLTPAAAAEKAGHADIAKTIREHGGQ